MAALSRGTKYISHGLSIRIPQRMFTCLSTDFQKVFLQINLNQYRHFRTPSRYQAFVHYKFGENQVPKEIQHLHMAIKLRSPYAAWQAFRSIEKAGLTSSLLAEDFSSIIRTFRPQNASVADTETIQKFRNNAIKIMQKMKALGYKPDVRDYNSLLQLLSRGRTFLTDCEALWREMERMDITPNIISYNIYMGVYIRAKQYGKVFDIYSEILDKQILPDTATYNILIETYGAIGQLKEANKLFHDIFMNPRKSDLEHSYIPNRAAPKLQPTIHTFNKLLTAHAQNADLKGMDVACDKLLSAFPKIRPDVNFYNARIRQHVVFGSRLGAKEYFYKMLQRGVNPTWGSFKTLVNHELAKAKTGTAEFIIQTMREVYGIEPSDEIYRSLIKMHTKKKRREAAAKVLQEWKNSRENSDKEYTKVGKVRTKGPDHIKQWVRLIESG